MKHRIQGILIAFAALAVFCMAGTHFGWFVSGNTVWLLLLLFVICVPVDLLLDWGLEKLGLRPESARLIKISLAAFAIALLTTIF